MNEVMQKYISIMKLPNTFDEDVNKLKEDLARFQEEAKPRESDLEEKSAEQTFITYLSILTLKYAEYPGWQEAIVGAEFDRLQALCLRVRKDANNFDMGDMEHPEDRKPTISTPGFVTDRTNGLTVEKRIEGARKVGVSWQMLLQSQLPN